MTARMTALRLIIKTEKGAYSNLALKAALKESGLSERDKALAARLFYGVCERRLTLEHIASCLLSRPLERLDPEVKAALLMGLYQIMYMDSIPDSAAVNESAELVKKAGKASAAGLVNGVLRRFIREGKKIPPVNGGLYDRLSVKYSVSAELAELICKGYGEENAVKFLEASLAPKECVLRANTLLITPDELGKELSGRGIDARVSDVCSGAVTAGDIRDIEREECFMKGLYHVQDLSSQMCCKAVSPARGMKIADLCAAPGGKSFTIAQLMEDEGELLSGELHEKRAVLIKKGAERLHISCIKAFAGDAREHLSELEGCDRVLCDVPCSGYGVIRGKPELRYKPVKDAERLPAVQLDILKSGAEYVKPGGLLIYSTCTVNREENERTAEKFLEEDSRFSGDMFPEEMGECFKGKFMKTVFTEDFGGDGFFICRMRRVR